MYTSTALHAHSYCHFSTHQEQLSAFKFTVLYGSEFYGVIYIYIIYIYINLLYEFDKRSATVPSGFRFWGSVRGGFLFRSYGFGRPRFNCRAYGFIMGVLVMRLGFWGIP